MRRKAEEQTSRTRLGVAIRRLRSERGLNRRDLERRTELSYPYLSEIESGKKTPSTQTLRRIAQALGMEAHELLQEAEAGLGSRDRSASPYFHRTGAKPSTAALNLVGDEQSLPPNEGELDELIAIARELEPHDRALLTEFARRLTR